MNADTPQPPLVFIFDHVRLRSHLFFRFLSTSPNVQPIYHPFLIAAFFGPGEYTQHLQMGAIERSEGTRNNPHLVNASSETFPEATSNLNKAVSDAQAEGKLPLVNEHWSCVVKLDNMLGIVRGSISSPSELETNPTYIPDHLFDILKPVILIRHPVNAINSIYRDAVKFSKQRPGDEQFGLFTANKPLRILFDLFRNRPGKQQPIVVDGDDLLWRTDEVSRGLCSSLGLEHLSDTWNPTSQEEIETMNPWVYQMTQHIHESHGIERPEGGEPETPSIDTAVRQWTEKYGQKVAEQLKGLVMINMPHYEYLQQFKV